MVRRVGFGIAVARLTERLEWEGETRERRVVGALACNAQAQARSTAAAGSRAVGELDCCLGGIRGRVTTS